MRVVSIAPNSKLFGALPVTIEGRKTVTGGGHRILSFEVHKLMVWAIVKNYSPKYGRPSNVHCGFENDRGVVQFTVSCDFPGKVAHFRQDYYSLIENGFALKMFTNIHTAPASAGA